MITITPRGRGAPKQDPVDVVRTRLWSRVVQLRSGLETAYALELEVEPSEEKGVKRPRKWDRYKIGKTVPKKLPGRRDSVALAEARYPGTSAWFHSPLWRVLKKETLDLAAIHEAITTTLGATVVELLYSARTEEETPHGQLEQRLLDADHFVRLAAMGSFDALVATVLLIQQSALIGSPEFRQWGFDCYEALQPAIAHAPETSEVFPELFTLIDDACPRWVYIGPNHRMNFRVFWHERARTEWAAPLWPFIEQRLGWDPAGERWGFPNKPARGVNPTRRTRDRKP